MTESISYPVLTTTISVVDSLVINLLQVSLTAQSRDMSHCHMLLTKSLYSLVTNSFNKIKVKCGKILEMKQIV